MRRAVTGVAKIELLRVSLITPWRIASVKDRISFYNDLLLAVHIDALFDNGFISFDDKGQILISGELTKDGSIYVSRFRAYSIQLGTRFYGMRLGLYFGHVFSRMLHVCCLTPSKYPLLRFLPGGPNILSGL